MLLYSQQPKGSSRIEELIDICNLQTLIEEVDFFLFGTKHRYPHPFYNLLLILFESCQAFCWEKLSQRYHFHFHKFQTRDLKLKNASLFHLHQHPLVRRWGFFMQVPCDLMWWDGISNFIPPNLCVFLRVIITKLLEW